MEIFFNVFIQGGESRLGIYRPPGGSEVVNLEQFPDEAILRLFPARVDALGQRTSFPSAFALLRRLPLSLRASFGPLGSERGSDGGGEVGVWWYTGNLEGSRSARRSRRG